MIVLVFCIFAIAVVSTTAWIYTAIAMIAHPKNTSMSKKILHFIIGIVCGVVIVTQVFSISYGVVRWGQFEKKILQHYQVVENIGTSNFRITHKIVFYVNPDELDFETAEEIFQLTLEELQNKMFFNYIKNRNFVKTSFKMKDIEVTFYRDDEQGGAIYRFMTVGNHSYNKWKVSLSREREHIDKEYYREISPKVGE